MSLLDAHIPQMMSSHTTFGTTAALMRGVINQAENSAVAAQAFHIGSSSRAFQAAHARFVEVASKLNTLLDIAETNIGSAVNTYVSEDISAAGRYTVIPH